MPFNLSTLGGIVGYVGDSNQFFQGDQVVLAPSAVRTTNGSGTPVATDVHSTTRLDLNVTAASGTTPSMTVTVETSKDGATNWVAAGAFAAVTTTGVTRKTVGGLDRFVRVSWAITGTTPSFTFTVSGELI
jgi:hypothetical protein